MSWWDTPPAPAPVNPGDGPQGPQRVASVGAEAAQIARDNEGNHAADIARMPWQGEDWCSDFVKYCWMTGGATQDVDELDAWAAHFYDYGVQHGTLHFDHPQEGDAVVFDYSPRPSEDTDLFDYNDYASHVAIVTHVNDDGTIDIANGNWGSTPGTSKVVMATIGDHQGATQGKQTVSGFISPVEDKGLPLTQTASAGIVMGPQQHIVAVAHPSTVHSGGQAVVTGSSTVFVGEEQAPIARHGDRTADGGTIVDQSDEGVYSG